MSQEKAKIWSKNCEEIVSGAEKMMTHVTL